MTSADNSIWYQSGVRSAAVTVDTRPSHHTQHTQQQYSPVKTHKTHYTPVTVRMNTPALFGLQTDNISRDSNHNDKTNSSFYTNKDSSIAALEAFQREYLPRVTNSGSGARLPSTTPASVTTRPMSPPSPGYRGYSSPDTYNSHNFDEQFKDVR